ncbi:hypothetical protein L9F63_025295 [Diploptera punctata]|uniref:NUA/TPR/MLP1-2-like domain-containing protein n=1 Tax=Diploptera punctata TaxID=6984 RepID=A0AAD7ZCI5_DIPPU|nr:hypothetical protein L9F63_025295 [Diploptera punctata]
MSDDAAAKSEELTVAVKELQKLLEDASDQYGELESEMKKKDESYEEELGKKNECIKHLKKELELANEMLKTAKQERLDTTIESMSPSAAAASRLLKSGMTLTQIYSQYVAVSEELMLEKEETRKLNLYINTILEEIEEKAPLLKKQKEDYEAALENIATLTKHIDECTAECNKLRFETTEAQKLASHHSRENERLKQEMVDLAKQVVFFLKKLKRHELDFSSQIISQRLVTFSSIEQLQEKNQQLLAVVRELSKKKEEIERMNAQCDVEELTKELNKYKQANKELDELNLHHTKMIEALLRQKDMYQKLYQEQLDGTNKQKEQSPKPMRGQGPYGYGQVYMKRKDKFMNLKLN